MVLSKKTLSYTLILTLCAALAAWIVVKQIWHFGPLRCRPGTVGCLRSAEPPAISPPKVIQGEDVCARGDQSCDPRGQANRARADRAARDRHAGRED